MPDLRLITAGALIIIGLCFMVFALRIKLTHPVNRVFTIGPFVTDAGLALVLRHISLIFILGMYALAQATADIAYYFRAQDHISWLNANWLSFLSSLMAVLAAAYVLAISKELWHIKRTKKRETLDD